MLEYKTTGNFLNFDLIKKELDLKAGDKTADFGCGRSGAFSFLLAKIVGKNGMVSAIDIIKDHLFLIKKEADEHNFLNIKVVWADLEKANSSKLATASLDAVLIINMLHQCKKPENVIAEANRVLKKGGQLLIIDWTRSAAPFGPSEKIDQRSLKAGLNEFGLSLKKEFVAGKHHFGLIFNK